MVRFSSFLFLGFVLSGPCSGLITPRQNAAPTVTVKNGSYYGIFNPTYDQDIFLGIPFAQPPVGDLRLRNPVSLNTTWKVAKNATQYSYECIGYGSDDWVLGNPVSEDCLTLNIIRPKGINPGTNLPVAVWIYGGGGTNGGSLDPRYNLSFIVQQSVKAGKPIIGVSLNYRLHAYGYLWGTAVAKAGIANIGYKDQRMALYWLKENIGAFGGDSSKVTIWGESAGANSVGMQIVAYGGRDDKLFRGAIQQSGSPMVSTKYINASDWDKYYNNITKATNCSNAADTLDCLRKVPISILSPILNSSVTSQVPAWGSQIDNDFLQDSASKQLLDGRFVKVPLLHGRNFDEGTMFAPKGINTTDQFLANVISTGPDNATALTIAALYPDIPSIGIPATLKGRPPPSEANLGVQWKRAASFVGDLRQHATRRLVSQVYASNNVSSWSYHFNVLVHGLSPSIGATHFQEVVFVFYNLDGYGYNTSVAVDPMADEPPTFPQLANIMSRMWISFVADGDPNHSGATNIVWPKYTLENPQNIVFDVNATNLLYVEPDTYRAPGIAYIQERIPTVFGR